MFWGPGFPSGGSLFLFFFILAAQALFLWWAGLVALHMWYLSFPVRGQTLVLCIGRWILNHWTTREVPQWRVLNGLYMSGAGEARTAFSVYLLDIPISPFFKCAIRLKKKKKKTAWEALAWVEDEIPKEVRRNTEDLGRTEWRKLSGVGISPSNPRRYWQSRGVGGPNVTGAPPLQTTEEGTGQALWAAWGAGWIVSCLLLLLPGHCP